MPSIAVIIPFFARGPAVLARTVRTVLGQKGVPTPLVIVVDDGSPQPASVELSALGPDEMRHVRVIRQPNGGPPFARNTGLDAVPDNTDWVALLDADDVWEEDHLARAVLALEQGNDFYFSNFDRLGFVHFTRCGFDPSPHPLLPVGGTLHAFAGDFFTRNLTDSPVGTSTVVFRRSVLGDLRFPLFPWTWEDLMFWLEAADRTKRIVFDAKIAVHYDAGGIAGADGWQSPLELRRKLWYIQHFANVRERFRLTTEQRAIVDAEWRAHTFGFVVSTYSLLRRRHIPDRKTMLDFIKWNPAVLWYFIYVPFHIAFARLLGRPTGVSHPGAG